MTGTKKVQISGKNGIVPPPPPYLGVLFDKGIRENVHLEKMKEKAEKWRPRIGCMSRVNGEMEVDRDRLI